MGRLADAFASPHLVGLFGLKPIKQTIPGSSAACCVTSVLRFLDMYAHEEMCANAIGVNRVIGSSPEDMMRFLSSKKLDSAGFSNYPIECLIDRVRLSKPTIIQRRGGNDLWMLVAGLEPLQQTLVFMDPTQERGAFRASSIAEFADSWERSPGVAVLADRVSSSASAKRKLKQTNFRVYDYFLHRIKAR